MSAATTALFCMRRMPSGSSNDVHDSKSASTSVQRAPVAGLGLPSRQGLLPRMDMQEDKRLVRTCSGGTQSG